MVFSFLKTNVISLSHFFFLEEVNHTQGKNSKATVNEKSPIPCLSLPSAKCFSPEIPVGDFQWVPSEVVCVVWNTYMGISPLRLHKWYLRIHARTLIFLNNILETFLPWYTQNFLILVKRGIESIVWMCHTFFDQFQFDWQACCV